MAKCIGGFPSKCDNEAGPRNPMWCDKCNEIRIEQITKSLEDMVKRFE